MGGTTASPAAGRWQTRKKGPHARRTVSCQSAHRSRPTGFGRVMECIESCSVQVSLSPSAVEAHRAGGAVWGGWVLYVILIIHTYASASARPDPPGHAVEGTDIIGRGPAIWAKVSPKALHNGGRCPAMDHGEVGGGNFDSLPRRLSHHGLPGPACAAGTSTARCRSVRTWGWPSCRTKQRVRRLHCVSWVS